MTSFPLLKTFDIVFVILFVDFMQFTPLNLPCSQIIGKISKGMYSENRINISLSLNILSLDFHLFIDAMASILCDEQKYIFKDGITDKAEYLLTIKSVIMASAKKYWPMQACAIRAGWHGSIFFSHF